MAAILPLAETVILGGVDGALRSADTKAGRSSLLKQWSLWYEAAILAGGAIAAMRRVHPDWWEPAVVGGLFALSQRGGAFAGHQVGFGPTSGMFIGGDAGGGPFGGGPYQPSGMLGGPAPRALPVGARRQPAGMFG